MRPNAFQDRAAFLLCSLFLAEFLAGHAFTVNSAADAAATGSLAAGSTRAQGGGVQHPQILQPPVPQAQQQQHSRQLHSAGDPTTSSSSSSGSKRPLLVAHRGASGLLPEHTVPAYLTAIQQGADFIECDVVVTLDLQLICRHEPDLNDTTNAMELFSDRAATYVIDGQPMRGIFASDLTLAEVKTLRAKQRLEFRDHSHDGQYGIVTFEEFLDLALAAGRPVGVYPEAKHPSWHNSMPALQAAGTTLEELMVRVLHSRGYAASAPHGSTAWRAQPIFIQCFEVTSLRRFAALTPVPLALLLDAGAAPDTGLSLAHIVSDEYLAEISSFVSVVAPWKALFYTLVDKRGAGGGSNNAAAPGLALPAAAAAVNNTDSNRRLLLATEQQADADGVAGSSSSSGSGSIPAAGLSHPDVPMSSSLARRIQATQQLQSTGLVARLHSHGFLVHTYTLRDEGRFVLPTCSQDIACEFAWLFEHEALDGAFSDWPGTMHAWLEQEQREQQRQGEGRAGVLSLPQSQQQNRLSQENVVQLEGGRQP